MLFRLTELQSFSYKVGEHYNPAMTVAFSPDGARLASGGMDNTIRLWDLRQPSASPSILRRQTIGNVYSVAFSPDGTRLVEGNAEITSIYGICNSPAPQR
jgi:WD40 repeat protein